MCHASLRSGAHFPMLETWGWIQERTRLTLVPTFLTLFHTCVGGRYLSDVWVLDPMAMTWQQLPTRSPYQGSGFTPNTTSNPQGGSGPSAANGVASAAAEPGTGAGAAAAGGLPPIAGHTVTLWKGQLYILGGHSKVRGARGRGGEGGGEGERGRGGKSVKWIEGCLLLLGTQ